MSAELSDSGSLDDPSSFAPMPTHYEQIAAFLTDSDPATLVEIELETGISRSSIAAVVYRTHREMFESAKTKGRYRRWKLKEDGKAKEGTDA